MVLNRMEEGQFHPCPVPKYQTISRCPIVIGRHKSLNMEPSRTSRGQDDRLRLDIKIFLRLHVIENGTGTMTMLVQDQLYRRGEFQYPDILDPISGLIPEGSHDFSPRDVRGVMHPLPARASTV